MLDSMKIVINVIRTNEKPIISPTLNSKVYFQASSDKLIHQGDVVECDECGKSCVSNSVGILNFPKGVTSVLVHNIMFDADELSYNEERGQYLCSTCEK